MTSIQLFVLHVLMKIIKYVTTTDLLSIQNTISSTGSTSIHTNTNTNTSVSVNTVNGREDHDHESMLHILIASTIGLLTSSVIDLRQAVIFLYVELYHCLGDALWSYLHALTQTQKTLLSIYIERQQKLKQQHQPKHST